MPRHLSAVTHLVYTRDNILNDPLRMPAKAGFLMQKKDVRCYTNLMFWNKYFLPSFLVMLLVAVLHWFGSLNYLYFITNWYDFPMHFLGGAWVALFTLWAVSTQYGSFFKKYVTLRNLVLWVFFVGVAWEFLELALQFTNFHDIGYTWDTSHDLIMDIVGASFIAFVCKKSIQTNF